MATAQLTEDKLDASKEHQSKLEKKERQQKKKNKGKEKVEDDGGKTSKKKLKKKVKKHYWLGKAKEARPNGEEDYDDDDDEDDKPGSHDPRYVGIDEPSVHSNKEPSKEELIAAMESVVATLGGTLSPRLSALKTSFSVLVVVDIAVLRQGQV
jgi:hypothetical protein